MCRAKASSVFCAPAAWSISGVDTWAILTPSKTEREPLAAAAVRMPKPSHAYAALCAKEGFDGCGSGGSDQCGMDARRGAGHKQRLSSSDIARSPLGAENFS